MSQPEELKQSGNHWTLYVHFLCSYSVIVVWILYFNVLLDPISILVNLGLCSSLLTFLYSRRERLWDIFLLVFLLMFCLVSIVYRITEVSIGLHVLLCSTVVLGSVLMVSFAILTFKTLAVTQAIVVAVMTGFYPVMQFIEMERLSIETGIPRAELFEEWSLSQAYMVVALRDDDIDRCAGDRRCIYSFMVVEALERCDIKEFHRYNYKADWHYSEIDEYVDYERCTSDEHITASQWKAYLHSRAGFDHDLLRKGIRTTMQSIADCNEKYGQRDSFRGNYCRAVVERNVLKCKERSPYEDECFTDMTLKYRDSTFCSYLKKTNRVTDCLVLYELRKREIVS